MEFLTLDIGGVLLAIVFGIMLIGLGLGLGYFFLVCMLFFLVLSAIVTYTGYRYKKRSGLGQESRGIRNVLANGIPPLAMAAIFYGAIRLDNGTIALLAAIGFVAAVAGITADKFNSEIGVLNGKPRMIFTMKRVSKGTSGGVTLLGTVAGIIGAAVVALLVLTIAPTLALYKSAYRFGTEKAVAAIVVGGFIGSVVDTMAGYFEEHGIGNKFTSNFLCGIVAGLAAMAVFAIA